MMKQLITAAASLYIGAGLSLGLVMAQVLPLSTIGIGFYAVTWPHQVYCARPDADCFGAPDNLPIWLLNIIFDLETDNETS